MTSKSNETIPTVENPYRPKPSYKDALLANVNDATIRMGINTFKLINSLGSKFKHSTAIDDASNDSDTTMSENNTTTLTSYRMRFQTTLQDTTQDTFMTDLSEQINEILEIININTPGVKLAPWHNNDIKAEELITSITDSAIDAVRYFHGFKAGATRSGTQYFRIRIVFPNHYTPDDIVSKNKGSIMIVGKQSLLKANSQCINPTVVGWFFRSNPSMVDFSDLGRVLKALWNTQDEFGLYWEAVRDGKPYDPATTVRAIHLEAEETMAKRLCTLAEKTYGKASKKVEDYPLGMNMMFVQQYGDVKGSVKALVTKLSNYQQKHEQVMEYATWYGELALDKSIYTDKFSSLQQWLMNVNSIQPKRNKDNKQYHDRVFTSIHKANDGQETRFYFSKVNSTEATNIIAALPLLIKTTNQT
jgi:hypothetical protein